MTQHSAKVAIRYYPQGNFGDDLLVRLLVQRYENQFLIDPRPHSASSGATDPFADLTNLQVRGTGVGHITRKLLDRVRRRVSLVGQPVSKEADLLVYIGGSIFIEPHKDKLFRREVLAYQRFGKQYCIVGANFGPYRTDGYKRCVKKILANASYVSFRDEKSKAHFSELSNVKCAPDIVFGMDTSSVAITEEGTAVVSVIGVNNRFDSAVVQAYESLIAELSAQLVAEGYQVELISFCAFEGDEVTIERILAKINPNAIANVSSYRYRGDIAEVIRRFARAELVVASRFHAAVLGFVLNKPVLPLIYSDKMQAMLDGIGFQGQSVDIRKGEHRAHEKVNFKNIPVRDIDDYREKAVQHFEWLDRIATVKSKIGSIL